VRGLRWRDIVLAFTAVALLACGPSGQPAPVQQGAPAAAPAAEQPRAASASTSHDLSEDEALGGHTLARHVGKSDAELIRRLERERQISSASTFTDRATAERVVGAALRADNRAFAAWRTREGPRPNFVLRYRAERVIGRSMMRGRPKAIPCDRALVVLRWDERRQRHYVLTSYPEANR
jgi:hypothetical protein